MGRTYYGIHKLWKETFDCSFYGGMVLDYLCWGIKKKFGLYAPMSKEQCRMIATILRNKLNIIKIWKDDDDKLLAKQYNLFINVNNERDYLDSDETINFIERAIQFFDNIDGLHDDEGYNEE
jgi:hypothetical protein